MQAFKSNRLFSYGCSGQTKLGEGHGGHKSKICRYDFHLKAYFLKKWNYCSPGVLERLEKFKKHRISSQKNFKKVEKIFFRKTARYTSKWVQIASWASPEAQKTSQTPKRCYLKILSILKIWFFWSFKLDFWILTYFIQNKLILTSFQIQ